MTTKRLEANDRKQSILNAALKLSETTGYMHITREAIALEADCSPGLVSRYLGTMANMRRDVMRAAVKQRNLAVVAQGLAARDPHARRAPDDLKAAAVDTLTH